MLIPIRHENMSARRWPIVTFALIAINVTAFLATHDSMGQQAPQLRTVKVHILLAGMYPKLNIPPRRSPSSPPSTNAIRSSGRSSRTRPGNWWTPGMPTCA
jgi:hypothetical protein